MYCTVDNQENEIFDPIAELLKYSFVVKTSLGSLSRAAKLEDAVNQLVDDDGNCDTIVDSTLEFLYGLKSYETVEKDDLVNFLLFLR